MGSRWHRFDNDMLVTEFSSVNVPLLSNNNWRNETSVWGHIADRLLTNTASNRSWLNLIWTKNRRRIRELVLKSPEKQENFQKDEEDLYGEDVRASEPEGIEEDEKEGEQTPSRGHFNENDDSISIVADNDDEDCETYHREKDVEDKTKETPVNIHSRRSTWRAPKRFTPDEYNRTGAKAKEQECEVENQAVIDPCMDDENGQNVERSSLETPEHGHKLRSTRRAPLRFTPSDYETHRDPVTLQPTGWREEGLHENDQGELKDQQSIKSMGNQVDGEECRTRYTEKVVNDNVPRVRRRMIDEYDSSDNHDFHSRHFGEDNHGSSDYGVEESEKESRGIKNGEDSDSIADCSSTEAISDDCFEIRHDLKGFATGFDCQNHTCVPDTVLHEPLTTDAPFGSEISSVRHKFLFTLSADSWLKIKPHSGENRRRLQKEYANVFSDQVGRIYKACVLVFTYNNVMKEDSRKRHGDYFTGKANCKHQGCAKFQFSITKEPEEGQSVDVAVIRIGNIVHKEEEKEKRKLTGDARRMKQNQLKLDGVTNTYYETIAAMNKDELEGGNISRCQTRDVLRKALSEALKKEHMHENKILELILIQELLHDEDDASEKIRGYIHFLAFSPFIAILYTEPQISMLARLISSGECILYLDATGTLVSKVKPGGHEILYYALVSRHSDPKQPPIPLAELLSENQATHTISLFLMHIRYALVTWGLRNPRPRRIEVDFSWALINSALLTFNQEDARRYLSRCWQVVHGNGRSEEFTVLHICASHMIKSVQVQLVDAVKDTALVEFCLRVFALLQNCTNLDEAAAIWRNFLLVTMHGEKNRETEESLAALKKLIVDWGHSELQIEEDVDAELIVDDHVKGKKHKTLREVSPFTTAFTETSTIPPADKQNEVNNEFYCPKGADILERRYLHLYPLWSGLMLGDLLRYKVYEENDVSFEATTSKETRDSNACVENWFRIMKHDNMQGKKRLRPGSFIRKAHVNLKGRMKAFAYGLTRSKLRSSGKRQRSVMEDRDFSCQEETWKGKGSCPTPNKRPKYFSPPRKFPQPKLKKKKKQTDVNCKCNDVGLVNQGNTCWLNSCMQAIKFTEVLGDMRLDNTLDPFLRRLYETVQEMTGAIRGNSYSLTGLLETIEGDNKLNMEFRRNDQHDAAAFLGFCIERLVWEYSFTPMTVQTQLTCIRCGKSKLLKPEDVNTLHVEMVTEGSGKQSVQGCIDEYFKDEILNNQYAVMCDVCKTKTPQEKKQIVKQMPDYLIVHLKRFNYMMRKVERKLQVSRQVTIEKCSEGEREETYWELQAIQCHRGRTLQSGHYFTIGLRDDHVVVFDDECVSCKPTTYIDQNRVASVSETCYLLHYKMSTASGGKWKGPTPDDAAGQRKTTMAGGEKIKQTREQTEQSEEQNNSDPEISFKIKKEKDTEKEHNSSFDIDQTDQKTVLHKAGFVLHKTDLDRLEGNMEITDSIINMYMSIIQDRNTLDEQLPTLYVFNTFFYKKLLESGHEGVERWTKHVDIFTFSLIFFPIHLQSHWCLAVADTGKKHISAYDSLGIRRPTILSQIRNYLEREGEAQHYFEKWTMGMGQGYPLQTNTVDCGVLVCAYAESIARRALSNLTQSDVPLLRKKIVDQLMSSKI